MIKSVITLIAIACLATFVFWPYRHTKINQSNTILTVGLDTNDDIRANTPVTIELDNSYQAKIQILSPYPVSLSYSGEIIQSTSLTDGFSASQQFLEFESPIVRGEMNFDYLPENAEIRLVSDNPYFAATFYKPTGHHYQNLLKDTSLFLIITVFIITTSKVLRN